MPNQLPTHKAIPMKELGKIEIYADYAQAILMLIAHDNYGDESGEFITNNQVIRTALSAVKDYISKIQEAEKTGYYFVDSNSKKEASNEK